MPSQSRDARLPSWRGGKPSILMVESLLGALFIMPVDFGVFAMELF